METRGQKLDQDFQFHDHMRRRIPVQVYDGRVHEEIGYVEGVWDHFVKLGDTYYSRSMYTFISRPGY